MTWDWSIQECPGFCVYLGMVQARAAFDTLFLLV